MPELLFKDSHGVVAGFRPKGGCSFGELDVWMSHGDRVVDLPPGFQIIASSDNAPMAAIADYDRQFFGLQFHPEVTHTPQGRRILQRFLVEFCGCRGSWTAGNVD